MSADEVKPFRPTSGQSGSGPAAQSLLNVKLDSLMYDKCKGDLEKLCGDEDMADQFDCLVRVLTTGVHLSLRVPMLSPCMCGNEGIADQFDCLMVVGFGAAAK